MPWIDQIPELRRAFIYVMSAAAAINDDSIHDAQDWAQWALDLAEHMGDQRLIANCQNMVGELHWQTGDSIAGERLQQAAITTVRATGDALGGMLFAMQMAGHLIDTGELIRAERILRDAAPEITRERSGALPLLTGDLAYLALLRNDLDAAGLELERSLAYHRDPPHRLPLTLAEGLVHGSELAAKRGDPLAGARLLGAARAICRRRDLSLTGMTVQDEQRTEAALRARLDDTRLDAELVAGERLTIPAAIDLAITVARLRSSVPPAGEPLDDLTPREREVLTLLVAGKSNPTIADALSISERTVTTHLSRIYAKLDVATRIEAMAEALRRGSVATGEHT